MDIDRHAIVTLFERYGFKQNYSSNTDSHAVFAIRSGYFHQAEILIFDPNDSAAIKATRQSLEDSGFACSSRAYRSCAELEERLFRGFFGVEDSQIRHHQHYDTFVKKVERVIGGPYNYIDAPFYRDDELSRDTSIVDTILAELSSHEPTLVLIEAAAGFGKTCTAYEVLSALLARRPNYPPLFIELARNRQAPLFRYVLLDEIDRNYPSLRSELVTSEIASGKVPLIIDGFDELLRRSMDDQSNNPEETKVESMLDTIAALLQGKAKIVLTTRKTAMFSAASFEAWAATKKDSFRSVRIILQEPSIRDWLGADRAMHIERLGSIARALANPVLLSFLRNAEQAQFGQYINDLDALVEHYFQTLLEREMERQDINIDHSQQLKIYHGLARAMITQDILSESRSVIAKMIRDQSASVLEESLRRYPPTSRPTLEQLSERLAGHALLDRVGSSDDQVGFVNEFVAGTLFGDVLISNDKLFCSEKVLDLATSSYRVRGADARAILYTATLPLQDALMPLEKLMVALRLLGRLGEDLCDETIESLLFQEIAIGDTSSVLNSVFVDCTFKRVRFFGLNIVGCGFVRCKFYGCEIIQECSNSWVTGGTSVPDSDMLERLVTARAATPNEEVGMNVEVLQQFWPKGKSYASSRLKLRTVYRGFPTEKRQKVTDALEILRRDGLIYPAGDSIVLNMDRIGEIREQLGR